MSPVTTMDYGLNDSLHAPFQLTDNNLLTVSAASSSWPASPTSVQLISGPVLDYYSNVGFQATLDYQYDSLLLPAAAGSLSIVDGGSDQYDSPHPLSNVIGYHLLDDSSVFGRCVGLKNDVAGTELGQISGSKVKRSRRRCSYTSVNNSAADFLTWEILSQYFYLPIAQAARELNIGLTLFKKRCRELGVRRWPHRKLMSIKSLIKNVKEMAKESNPAVNKETVRSAIEVLEKQRKVMEVMPDIQLEAQTKRLRQACFKANYKKRRLMMMNGGLANSEGSSSKGRESTTTSSVYNASYSSMSPKFEATAPDLEESEELRSLLFDSLSPSECMFLNDCI